MIELLLMAQSIFVIYWLTGLALCVVCLFAEEGSWDAVKDLDKDRSQLANISLFFLVGPIVAPVTVLAQALTALWAKIKGG